jgi:DtxR family Mn-dependent transcriptional regulator
MRKNGGVSDLIDTTEMYLRTIYELVEEGIVPLRARIAERLHQSGPTVSQTVARMERDGLLTVEGDRHLELTEEGMRLATRVMRKHRLAERLLTDVIGLDWELVHAEACRWEHVMSETVERRLVELLDHPTSSPYGNPIPGLHELGEAADGEAFMTDVEPLSEVAGAALARAGAGGSATGAATGASGGDAGAAVEADAEVSGQTRVLVRRISEEIQKDEAMMAALRRVGALPDKVVTVAPGTEGVLIGSGGESAEIDHEAASHMFVRRH